jgi:hypothetical protein
MKKTNDFTPESFLDEVKRTINIENWPKKCENCKAKITKKIWLRLHIVLPVVEDENNIPDDAMVELIKESWCEKCKDLIESGMVIETDIP